MNAATLALNPELFPQGALIRARTNALNTGKGFQAELERTFDAYAARGIARLRKVDPPVRIIWPFDAKQGKKVQRVIFMENPWLDYMGVWSARGGRAIMVEAKSTASHRLAFGGKNGLKSHQVESMAAWCESGAATCLLWQFAGNVVLFTPDMVARASGAGQKSLVFEDGVAVTRGEGAVIWDFLPVLQRTIWPPADAANNC